jgi:hypothetical protein
MAEEDLGSAITVLQNLSNMPKIADRLQQGILAFLFLGRLMRDPNGLAANPAFQLDGHTALDTSQLYFDGNSQGAILGGALTAVAHDFTRSTLAEAGMNYSLLLDRSVDFDDYLTILKPSYPNRYDRLVGLAVAQLLWDRGETNGYANDYDMILGGDLPTLYHVANTWENFDRLVPILDERLAAWRVLNRGPTNLL